MEKFLSEQFNQLDWLKDQEIALVGVVALHVTLREYINQNIPTLLVAFITIPCHLKDIDEVYDIIRKSSRDDLTNLDGLSRDRVDIILPAVSVFKTLLRKLMLHNSLSQERYS